MPFTINDLVGGGAGYREMTKSGVSQTCYDLAVYSLVMTGHLKLAVFQGFSMEVPKANTYLVVDPTADQRLTDPQAIPADCMIGFYRRFRRGMPSPLLTETNGGWIIFHMVRSMSVANSTNVAGGNNGDRQGTTPGWSANDVTRMFDWNGGETTRIADAASTPAAGSYGDNGIQEFVAFHAPIATAVNRLNRAFPGLAAFG